MSRIKQKIDSAFTAELSQVILATEHSRNPTGTSLKNRGVLQRDIRDSATLFLIALKLNFVAVDG